MADINNLTLTGRLVFDPVINQSATGQLLGAFTLASNYRHKNRLGELHQETAFVPCKVFGNWAKTLEQRKKGDQVVVSGRLRTEKWEKDGQPRSQLALVCESVRFLADQRLEPVATGEGIPF